MYLNLVYRLLQYLAEQTYSEGNATRYFYKLTESRPTEIRSLNYYDGHRPTKNSKTMERLLSLVFYVGNNIN